MSDRTDILRVVSLALVVVVLSLRRAERRLVGRLSAAGASGRDDAVRLSELGWRERLALKRLVWSRAVGLAGSETYFIDPAGYEAFRKRRRVRAAMVLGLVLVLAAVAWWRSR